jgi:hypothetical protein
MVDQPERGGQSLVKKQEDAAKEAFNGTAFAQFLLGPGGRQTAAVLLLFGIPGNDRDRSQDGRNPSNEAQTPIGGI